MNFAWALLLLALPGACARYVALPLPNAPRLASRVADLRTESGAIDAPLAVERVAALALRNAPDIVSARAQSLVGQANRINASLAPNPQITASVVPLVAGMGTSLPYSVAIDDDIVALVTLPTRRRAARATAAQVDAQLLWQAWQTVATARTLAVDLIEGERALALLSQAQALFDRRVGRSEAAVRQGNATLATLAPDVAAAQSARGAVDDLVRVQQQRRHQLNALLGLLPDAAVPLAPTATLPPIDPAAILAALPRLADRRPDLVALRLGYLAQDETLRAALLAQFPTLRIGGQGGSDNTNASSAGPQVTFDLPLFNRNQGGIAVARATRQQLHDEYVARLNAADGSVRAALAELALQQAQLDRLRSELPALERVASGATAAFASADLDERAYVDLVSARLAKRQQIVTTEQAELDSRAALATLIGADLPTLELPTLELARAP